MRRLWALVVVALCMIPAVGSFAQQFAPDIREFFHQPPQNTFVRSIASGVTPDSQRTPTLYIAGAKSVTFFFRANRAAVGAKTCSAAVFLVSQNDTDYFDASILGDVTVFENIVAACVTDSCNNYDRSVGLIPTAPWTRISNWKFGRAVVYWKVTAVSDGRIVTLASAPTAGGTGYTLNDVLTITTGGTGGTCIASGVTAGAVDAVTLQNVGLGYTTGAGKATSGGTGTGCTVNISAVTPAAATSQIDSLRIRATLAYN